MFMEDTEKRCVFSEKYGMNRSAYKASNSLLSIFLKPRCYQYKNAEIWQLLGEVYYSKLISTSPPKTLR
jgi:hypothetical protein